jgi:hypothetical protein
VKCVSRVSKADASLQGGKEGFSLGAFLESQFAVILRSSPSSSIKSSYSFHETISRPIQYSARVLLHIETFTSPPSKSSRSCSQDVDQQRARIFAASCSSCKWSLQATIHRCTPCSPYPNPSLNAMQCISAQTLLITTHAVDRHQPHRSRLHRQIPRHATPSKRPVGRSTACEGSRMSEVDCHWLGSS